MRRKHARNRQLGRNTAAWQGFRLKIIQRDHHACRDCGTQQRQLQVHRIGGGKHTTHDPENYLTVCARCHYARQRKEQRQENLQRLGLSR
jgi:5-methylcytosine-specific restriction endonuclease McrA